MIKHVRIVGLLTAVVGLMGILGVAGASTASAFVPCYQVVEKGTGKFEDNECTNADTTNEYIEVKRLVTQLKPGAFPSQPAEWCAEVEPNEGVYSESLCKTAGGKKEFIKVLVPAFVGAEYPGTIEAEATNYQGFAIAEAVSVCEEASFKSVAPVDEPSLTLTVHPEYEECEVELAGTHFATVNTKDCNYEFLSAIPETRNGAVNLVCAGNEEIEVEVEGIAKNECIIKIPGQSDLQGVEYINEPGGTVDVEAEVSHIKWSTTNACDLATKEGTNGEYREGELTPAPKLAPLGHPAKALTEGFNSAGGPDEIKVS